MRTPREDGDTQGKEVPVKKKAEIGVMPSINQGMPGVRRNQEEAKEESYPEQSEEA